MKECYQIALWFALVSSLLLSPHDLLSQSDDRQKVYVEGSLELGSDITLFANRGLYEGQRQYYPAFTFRPKASMEWNDGSSRIIFEGFGRWDVNGNARTHWDVRELYFQQYRGDI